MKNMMFSSSAKTTKGGKDIGKVLLSLLPTIIINAILPFLIYRIMKNVLHQSELLSLIATGVPSALDSIVRIMSTRRMNFIAGMAMLSIMISLLIVLLSRNPKLLLFRESFFTAALGLIVFVSLLFPKPLTYYVARTLETGDDAERQRGFMSKWEEPLFRLHMRTQAVIWGGGLLMVTMVSVPLIFSLTAERFLIISQFVQWGGFATTLVVSRAWMHLLQRRQPATQKRPQEDA